MERQGAEKARPLVSEKRSGISEKAGSQQENLSVTVVRQLVNLMENVVKTDINPKTVNAACNCANAIHKMILLNLSLKKQGTEK